MGRKRKEVIVEQVRLQKFVHGGQALAEDADGKKLLVWGGVPGELVDVRITRKKSSYREGVVTTVHEASEHREDPSDPENYLSTSPWQIVSFTAEITYKDEILRETFDREGVDGVQWSEFQVFGSTSHYRNKMEYGFWGDDDGLHFAHFVRGKHGKQIIDSNNSLANNDVIAGGQKMLEDLRQLDVRAGDLKTLVIRTAQDRTLAFALFVKNKDVDFSYFENRSLNLDIYYSDPRSPASVPTEKLRSFGDTMLTDSLLGTDISYGVTSFFQVNLGIFEKVLQRIADAVDSASAVDFYSGVGAIGIPVGARVLVESEAENIAMAKQNVGDRNIEVVHASSEQALEHITAKDVLIVDPPRAGLHKDVVKRILEAKPPKIVYLSCNPITQARDVALLQDIYAISSAQGYNFFPMTPHIESLIVLDKK